MALQQLSDEQIATLTRREKDEWWLANVFRGDMAQLTIRSAITGFFLGGVLSATALYIAGKTGITIGVGLTSVILAFAMYRIMNSMGFAEDFTSTYPVAPMEPPDPGARTGRRDRDDPSYAALHA